MQLLFKSIAPNSNFAPCAPPAISSTINIINTTSLPSATLPLQAYFSVSINVSGNINIGNSQPISFTNCNILIGNNTSFNISGKFNNCKIVMGTNSLIKTTSQGLTIENNTRIFSCNGMWQGIENHADLYIRGNTLISDANIAVNNVSGFIQINNTIFNRNNIAIQHSGNSSSPAISDIIITSRDFGLNYLSTNPNITWLKTPNNGIPNLESYPFIGTINLPIMHPYCGIKDDHGTSNSWEIGKFPLGIKDNNIFDNLDYGIISHNTSTYCVNNTFQHLYYRTTNNPQSLYGLAGVAIIADGNTSTTNLFSLTVGDGYVPLGGTISSNTNSFFDCAMGINSLNYSNNSIRYNTFTNETFINPSYNLSRVLRITPASGGSTAFENNITDGYLNSTICTVPIPNFYYTKFSFSYNHFANNASLMSPLFTGINSLFSGISTMSAASPFAEFIGNTIDGICGTGFAFYNFVCNKKIEQNNINLVSGTSSTVAGIILNSSDRAIIRENSVTGDYTSGAITKATTGITINNSKECRLECNQVSNVRQGFIFDGNCTATKGYVFTYNAMTNCNDGLVLRNSIGGIGKNGSLTSPAENTWNGFFNRSQSLADNANFNFFIGGNKASYFYCRPFAIAFPTNNSFIGGATANDKLFPQLANGSLINRCFNNSNPDFLGDAISIDALKELIIDASQYPVLEPESEWLNKKYAYEKLLFDPEFAGVSDPELDDFTDSLQNENIAAVAWTDEMIKQYDYYFAHYLVNGLSPQNLIEENYKNFNHLYLNWCQNQDYQFSSVELAELQAIANQCANLGGRAVLQAQIFLDYLFQQESSWNSNCPIPASAARKSNAIFNKRENVEYPIQNYFSIHPNPAENFISIDFLKTDRPIQYSIYDLCGTQINCNKEIFNPNNIDISQFQNGLYFLKCKFENGKEITRKFTIIKK